MRKYLYILILISMFTYCSEHNKTIVKLNGFANQTTVVYQTENADYYIGYKDLVEYCKDMDNGEPNDFTYSQIIEYIESYPNQPILIPDTLGTKLEKESEVFFTENDSLVRVRDQGHPYAYITDDVAWSIIKFAKEGKLKIYVKDINSFVDTIVVDRVETDWYGETNITLTNDSIIFSQLRWIN